MKYKSWGFTLIEILIVIAIIGIVAAIAIPNLLVAMQKSKQKSSMGDMRVIGGGIEAYITDHTVAPQVGSGTVENLRQPYFIPFYVEIFPAIDFWGISFNLDISTSDAYSVICLGRDHANGGPAGVPVAGDYYQVTRLLDFNNDIVYSNGQFTFGPIRK